MFSFLRFRYTFATSRTLSLLCIHLLNMYIMKIINVINTNLIWSYLVPIQPFVLVKTLAIVPMVLFSSLISSIFSFSCVSHFWVTCYNFLALALTYLFSFDFFGVGEAWAHWRKGGLEGNVSCETQTWRNQKFVARTR